LQEARAEDVLLLAQTAQEEQQQQQQQLQQWEGQDGLGAGQHVLAPPLAAANTEQPSAADAAEDEAAPLLQPRALQHQEQQQQQQQQEPRLRLRGRQPAAPAAAPPPPPPVEWYQQRPAYPLQLLALGAAWAASVVAAHCALFVLPVAAGRALFSAAGLPAGNDLLAAALGGLALWGAAAGAGGAARAAGLRGLRAAALAAGRWAVVGAKVVALAVLWLGVVATLLGVLFELVLLPLRLPANQTALLYLYQDWTMGVLALKLWHMLAAIRGRDAANGGGARGGGGGGAAAADGAPWHAHLEALQAQGVRDLDFGRALRRVVLPVLSGLLTALAVPFVVTRGLLPLLGLPAPALQAANLYGYAACHGAYLVYLAGARLRRALRELHNAIRDDRYLLGRRLNNFAAHGGGDAGGVGVGEGGGGAAGAQEEGAGARVDAGLTQGEGGVGAEGAAGQGAGAAPAVAVAGG
jgi:hypothetical protein